MRTKILVIKKVRATSKNKTHKKIVCGLITGIGLIIF